MCKKPSKIKVANLIHMTVKIMKVTHPINSCISNNLLSTKKKRAQKGAESIKYEATLFHHVIQPPTSTPKNLTSSTSIPRNHTH